MNQEKYTDRMRGFLQSAQMLALREGHQRLVPDHLLKVLLDDPEGLAANLIGSAGGDSRAVHRAVETNLAKQPKGPRLLAPFMAFAGVCEYMLGQSVGLLHGPGTEIGLLIGEGEAGHIGGPPELSQHGESVCCAARQGVGQRQIGSTEAVKEGDVRLLTQGDGLLQHWDGLFKGALMHMQWPQAKRDGVAVVGPIDRLGELEGLGAIGHAVGKSPQFTEALHQVEARLEAGRTSMPKYG